MHFAELFILSSPASRRYPRPGNCDEERRNVDDKQIVTSALEETWYAKAGARPEDGLNSPSALRGQ